MSLVFVQPDHAELEAGTVFKDFTYPGPLWGELSSTATAAGALTIRRKPHTPVELDLPDLSGVIGAAILVQYWGGHLGTSEQSVSVNDHPWMLLPQPKGTPGRPECYYRMGFGNPGIKIPVEQLHAGKNAFSFHAGPQIAYDFKWGFFWIYSFVVRLYYGDQVQTASCVIRNAAPEQVSGDVASLRLDIETSGMDNVKSIDLVGRFHGYDWDCRGEWLAWRYRYQEGSLAGHLGSIEGSSGSIAWDTTWVPDQDEAVQVMPLIHLDSGLTVAGPVSTFELRRTGRSVRMFTAIDVPENFGVRIGQGKTCKIPVTDRAGATRAVLCLSAWSAAHGDEIGLNGNLLVGSFGKEHDYSMDIFPVPLEILMDGNNFFYAFARTMHHALEVNWPGPVLMLEYR